MELTTNATSPTHPMITDAIQRFASAFVSGDLDPVSTHWVLLIGAIGAEFSVAAGIILESPKEKGCREKLGMALVLGGVLVSAVFTIGLFVFDEGISGKQQVDIKEARSKLAEAGLTIGELTATSQGMRERVSQAERDIKTLQEAAKISPSTTTPPATLPPIAPPSPPPQTAPPYQLTDIARRIIRDTTTPGAIVNVIPFMPNLERFASDLGSAFAAVPGVQVAVGHGNVIINGQTGLIVQYDHGSRVSKSVFEALVKAGLNPIDGPPTPGTPIAFIKVAPPQ